MRAGELNLTAMIDVAFQLLSFFIITLKPVDVLANLDVSRPAPDKRATQSKPLNILSIRILPDGIFALNDRVISRDNLDRTLTQLAEVDKNPTVLISCTPESTHGKLVEVLDICAKVGLANLSVVSE